MKILHEYRLFEFRMQRLKAAAAIVVCSDICWPPVVDWILYSIHLQQ
jgi:hypothetical protein